MILDELVLGLCCAGHGDWSLVCQMDGNPHPHLPRVMPHPKWVFGSDHGLSVDATVAPAILLEDSRPQAILKLRPPNSLDYRVRYEPHPSTLDIKPS